MRKPVIKDRTANGTFASLAPARNSTTVGFGFLFTLWHGLTRRVNGRKREERVGSCGEFCHQRKPLPHRLQCGSVIKRREGMAPALSGDECRAWAGHPVMIARTHHHHGIAPAHPSRSAGLGLLIHEQGFSGGSRVKPQASLLIARSVTGVAVLTEDRPDVTAKVNRCLIRMQGRGGRGQQTQAEDSQTPPAESFHYERTTCSHEYNP